MCLSLQRVLPPLLGIVALLMAAGLAGCATVSAPATHTEQQARPSPEPSQSEIEATSSSRNELIIDGHDDRGTCDPLHDLPKVSARHVLHWTPDGNRLVFNHESTLYMVAATGRELRALIDADPRPVDWGSSFPLGFSFDVSPDGTQVVYSSCEFLDSGVDPEVAFRRYEIGIINLDGSGKHRLTDNQHFDHNPVWSPDGERIAFVTNPDSRIRAGKDLYTMARDGTDIRLITPNVGFMPPLWSPDNTYLAIAGSTLYTFRLEDRVSTPIAEVGLPFTMGNPEPTLPSWSPDGTHLAFIGADEEGRSSGIYTVRPDGTDLIHVLEPPRERDLYYRDIHQVLWSPDGLEIMAVSEKELLFFKPDGTGLRTVDLALDPTSVVAGWSSNAGLIAVWSPDSARIAIYVPFDEHYNVEFQLYTVARDGTDRRDLVRLDGDGNLAPANPAEETQ